MFWQALKELQDPAAQARMRAMMEDPNPNPNLNPDPSPNPNPKQARMRAMMEDPEFQKSMQQYVEQPSP